MRVLVCGGRDYDNQDHVNRVLDGLGLGAGDVIIHGGATGADACADHWALERGASRQVYRADWSKGRAGGPIRNSRMLREAAPDLVVAFPGNKGTADMVKKARKAGVRVVELTQSA